MVAKEKKSGLGMPKILSQDKICEQPSEMSYPPTKPLITPGILVPLGMVAGFVYWLVKTSEEMDAMARADPSKNPVLDVWIQVPIAAMTIYVVAVFFGKKIMADREPLEIQQYVFVYNLYQVILNIWTVYEMIKEVYVNPWYTLKHGFLPWGHRPQPGYEGYRISFLVWVHYNNKFVELLDTIWMVLKKKNNQITFLHCYHHMLLIWVWWHCCSIAPGGEAWFGACCNSLIHVYMYGYYTLALLKIPVNFMKIYMTSAQMIQFVVCLCHASYVAYYQTSPFALCVDQAFVMTNMLYLFGKFFYKSYMKSSSKGGDGDDWSKKRR
jgi:elongation of very long chain fatty acids protein 4